MKLWNLVVVLACLNLVAVAVVAQATANPKPGADATTKPATTAAAPKVPAPASVPEMMHTAQGLFDAANTGDWTAAGKQLTTLQDALKKVKTDLPKPDTEQKKRITQLGADIAALAKAIKGKQQQPAIMKANRIIRVNGTLADTFINKVPQTVWQLQYLAREIRVWSVDPTDLTKLKALPARMDTVWAQVSKEVTARGGDALVREFTEEMAKLKTASTTDDFAKLAKPLLDTLDKIEKAYLQ